MVITSDAGLPGVQALVRWDPAHHASVELAARTEVGFPPAVRMASTMYASAIVAYTVALRCPRLIRFASDHLCTSVGPS